MNFADRVKDSSITTGTGPFTLRNSAPAGCDRVPNASSTSVPYAISDQTGSNWVVGGGTFSVSAPTVVNRTTVLSSSNSGSLASFSAGTKDVFVTPSANFFSTVPAPSFRDSTTAETLTQNDNGATVRGNATKALVYTIPGDATTAWPVGSEVPLYQAGTGRVSSAAGFGVTLRSRSGIPGSIQYGMVAALRTNANEWTLL